MTTLLVWLSARLNTLPHSSFLFAFNDTQTMNQSDDFNEPLIISCEPIYQNKSLYSLIVYFGSAVSIISAIENGIIFISLALKKEAWQSYFQYLILLALFESLLCGFYVPLFVFDVLAEKYHNLTLLRAWWSYYDVMMAACHVAMTASSFLILAATFERYLISMRRSKWSKWVNRHRPVLSASTIIVALAVKAPIAFEMTLVKNGNCTGMNEYYVDLIQSAKESFFFRTVYRFWTRNIVGVFAPFFLLAFFNFKIFTDAKKRHRRASLFRVEEQKYKDQLQAATRTLLFMVCIYLGSNILNVVITAMEFICNDVLASNYELYSAISDVISFVTVFSCGLRLPIYLTCSYDLRHSILPRKCYSNPGYEGETDEEESETFQASRRRRGSKASLIINGSSPLLIHLIPSLQHNSLAVLADDDEVDSDDENLMKETIV